MKAVIEGDNLVVTIPLQEPAPSASGKTMIVASTRGSQPSTAQVDGHPVTISLNAYFKP